MIKRTTILLLSLMVLFQACNKEKFLDKKPRTDLVVPETLADMTALLDNMQVMNLYSPGLPILSADEYSYSGLSDWNAADSWTVRNAYIWAKDIYAGEKGISDWNGPYQAIFYANSVLDQWTKLAADQQQGTAGRYVKGWALFSRAYYFYELLQTFALAYDGATAGTDPGIPLRLSSNINDRQIRASVADSYSRVLQDLQEASELMAGSAFEAKKPNRPSAAAVYALQSRVYLSMRDYAKAETAAAASLALNDRLIDYNSLDKNNDYPFDELNNPELLFFKNTNGYSKTITGGSSRAPILDELIRQYEVNDLRKMIFFRKAGNEFLMKTGYVGKTFWPFTGLAVDEVYLIHSECLARKGDLENALKWLNQLLEKRYVRGEYKAFRSASKQEVLNKILLERRKELIWRGLRWTDIKRLNKEGANLTLTRNLGGQVYTLPPNDPRYALPIPDDEIALSGIQQNQR